MNNAAPKRTTKLMLVYELHAPIGVFQISPELQGRWRLDMNGVALNRYRSAESAASAVELRLTGLDAWDSSEAFIKPQRLGEWERRYVAAV